jgi:GrpB-like predicted nucleotidyltransferase (UPF0157 family)
VAGPSDDEFAGIFVGGPTLHDDTIHLDDYDERWVEWFAGEAIRIRRALGDRAVSIAHVGSTSVPGLAAKPTVDIVMTVVDSAAETAYVPALEAAGYTLRVREPAWFEHRLLKGPGPRVNLHVFSAGCPEVDRMIRFRDHLRANAADRQLYERTKRALAAKRWTYVQHYADAKSDVVAKIWAQIDPAAGPPNGQDDEPDDARP